MIRSALLPRVRARREASRLSFVPRELTAEEHAELAATAARGAWDRGAEQRERDHAALMGTIYRARIACHDRDARPVAGVPMVDDQSWGGRG